MSAKRGRPRTYEAGPRPVIQTRVPEDLYRLMIDAAKKSGVSISVEVASASKEHARLLRQFIKGKIGFCPCGMDMERESIIRAFDEALAAKEMAQ